MTEENKPDRSREAEFPANSHKSKEVVPPKEDSRTPRDKIISGEAVERKKTLGRKIADTFSGEDMRSVGSYILFDVVVPAVKSMVYDSFSQGLERTLFGGDPRTRSSRPGSSHISYNKMYRSDRRERTEPSRSLSQRARSNHDFKEVIIESRGEAEQVLDTLQVLIDDYDVATVADFYDMIGLTGSFQDQKWGWADLRGAQVVRVREGYLLDLPRVVHLD